MRDKRFGARPIKDKSLVEKLRGEWTRDLPEQISSKEQAKAILWPVKGEQKNGTKKLQRR